MAMEITWITVTAISLYVSRIIQKKTEQMIRICRLSATSQYSFIFKNVRLEDL